MTNHQSLLTATALTLLLISGVAAPTLGCAAETSIAPEKKLEVRANEERRVAEETDKSYANQQRALAKQYRKAAKRAAKQGDDPTVLLKAAAYFDSKLKQDKKAKNNKVK